jgi:hypothetical protein
MVCGSSSESERRCSARYDVQGSARFGVHQWYLRRGRIHNLCLDGCLIEPRASTSLSPGDSIALHFKINRISFRARAIVSSVDPDGMLAVEIVDLSEDCRKRLLTLLDEVNATDA